MAFIHHCCKLVLQERTVLVHRRMGPAAEGGVHGERAGVFGEANGHAFRSVRCEEWAGWMRQLIEICDEVAWRASMSNKSGPTVM
jgi:hypothetical protein